MVEPKLRLQGYHDEWESIRMDELFEEIVEKGQVDLPVLSVRQGYGTVLRDESDRNIQYDKSNLKGYKVIKKNDFIIHLRSFEGGLECSNHDGISSPAYKILRTDKLIPELYRHYFRSYKFIEGKLGPAVVGIRDGRNIEMTTFWDTKLNIPSLEEQNEMAKVFTSVDEVISTLTEELHLWEEKKKGVMQKIFSQEVRFKNENGGDYPEWEAKKFYDCVNINANMVQPDIELYGDLPHIGPGNIEKATGRLLEYNLVKNENLVSGKYMFSETDVIYCKINPQLMKVAFPKLKGLCSADAYPISVKNEVMVPEFLFYSLLETRFIKYSISVSVRTGMPKINRDELGLFKFTVPCLAEQKKIADCLTSVDEVIVLKKQKLETWKNIKKGLLQQMFV